MIIEVYSAASRTFSTQDHRLLYFRDTVMCCSVIFFPSLGRSPSSSVMNWTVCNHSNCLLLIKNYSSFKPIPIFLLHPSGSFLPSLPLSFAPSLLPLIHPSTLTCILFLHYLLPSLPPNLPSFLPPYPQTRFLFTHYLLPFLSHSLALY